MTIENLKVLHCAISAIGFQVGESENDVGWSPALIAQGTKLSLLLEPISAQKILPQNDKRQESKWHVYPSEPSYLS